MTVRNSRSLLPQVAVQTNVIELQKGTLQVAAASASRKLRTLSYSPEGPETSIRVDSKLCCRLEESVPNVTTGTEWLRPGFA